MNLWTKFKEFHENDPLWWIMVLAVAIGFYLIILFPNLIMLWWDSRTPPDPCLPSKLHGAICAKK